MKRITESDVYWDDPCKIDLGDGFTAKITTPYDEDHGPPWKEADGHGPVSEWTIRDKRPGEWVLSSDRSSKRYYDFAQAVKIAKRDGWGLSAEGMAALTVGCGRVPTKGEIATTAVERDFEFLKGWCDDKWHWIGVVVKIVDADGDEVASDSLWGIEDNSDYWKEVAVEIVNRLADAIEKEAGEVAYWASRDVETVTV